MKISINTEDAYSTKICLPLKYVFPYGNLRAYNATLALLLLRLRFVAAGHICLYTNFIYMNLFIIDSICM